MARQKNALRGHFIAQITDPKTEPAKKKPTKSLQNGSKMWTTIQMKLANISRLLRRYRRNYRNIC